MKTDKSECAGGWLHRYEIIRTFEVGVEERCLICRESRFFPHNVSNFEYLSYHIRQALPSNHNRYHKEYAPTATTD